MFAFSGKFAEAYLIGDLDKHLRRSYMTTFDKIKHDQFEARKNKAEDAKGLLTPLLSKCKDIAKENHRETATDDECMAVIRQFLKGNTEVLEKATNEEALRLARVERVILEGYLPQQLSPEQLTSAVKGAIDQGAKNIGGVMKFLTTNFAGLYDGKAAKAEIEKQLS